MVRVTQDNQYIKWAREMCDEEVTQEMAIVENDDAEYPYLVRIVAEDAGEVNWQFESLQEAIYFFNGMLNKAMRTNIQVREKE